MVARTLARFVVAPELIEVSADHNGPDAQNRFGSLETPASAAELQPIVDQVLAPAFDDAARDWRSHAQQVSVAHQRLPLQQIRTALPELLALTALDVPERC